MKYKYDDACWKTIAVFWGSSHRVLFGLFFVLTKFLVSGGLSVNHDTVGTIITELQNWTLLILSSILLTDFWVNFSISTVVKGILDRERLSIWVGKVNYFLIYGTPSRLMIPCWHLCVLELLPGHQPSLNCSLPWGTDTWNLWFCCTVLNKPMSACVSNITKERQNLNIFCYLCNIKIMILGEYIHPNSYWGVGLCAVSAVSVSQAPQSSECCLGKGWWWAGELQPRVCAPLLWACSPKAPDACRVKLVKPCLCWCTESQWKWQLWKGADSKGLHSLMHRLPLPLWMPLQVLLSLFFFCFPFVFFLLFPLLTSIPLFSFSFFLADDCLSTPAGRSNWGFLAE